MTKGERREKIKRNRSKMTVSGAGLRNILRIKAEKAEQARKECTPMQLKQILYVDPL